MCLCVVYTKQEFGPKRAQVREVQRKLHREELHDFYSSSLISKGKGKGRAIPVQAWAGPEGPRKLRFTDFKTIGI